MSLHVSNVAVVALPRHTAFVEGWARRARSLGSLRLKDNRERIQHLHSVIAGQLQQHA
jgi:hypothetical protein